MMKRIRNRGRWQDTVFAHANNILIYQNYLLTLRRDRCHLPWMFMLFYMFAKSVRENGLVSKISAAV